MASIVLGTAGAIIGSAFGPFGAQVGWVIGSAIGGAIDPQKTKQQGPRLQDLKVTGVEYGQPIPYVQGTMRVAGQIWWASDRREIATTTSEGGKGGGPEVESTTYTYEVDLLYGLTDNEIAGVTRIWLNGKLIWTNLTSEGQATLLNVPEDAGFIVRALANVAASANTPHWARMTVYTGASDQLPDPTYEAAVGSSDAVAYRNRGTVFIEGLQLGGSGQIPNLTFEVVTNAVSSDAENSLVLLQSHFTSDFSDISLYEAVPVAQDTFIIEAGRAKLISGADAPNNVTYTGTGIADLSSPGTKSYTFETFIEHPAGSAGASPNIIFGISDASLAVDTRVRVIAQTTSPDYGRINVQRGGTILYTTSGTLTFGSEVHFCFMYRGSEDGVEHVWLFVDGVPIGDFATDQVPLPSSAPTVTIGDGPSVVPIYWDDIRLTVGLVYDTAGFTPPTKPLDDPISATGLLTASPEDLDDVVSRICVRAGLSPDQFDVTDLANHERQVRGMAISQISSSRTVVEMLMSAYFFEATVSDKIYFKRRSGSSALTIPYEDLGASMGQSVEPLALKLTSDIELPAQIALTYANWSDDYQADTQFSDRIISAVENSVANIQLPLALKPSEAKQIVDVMVADQVASQTSTKISLLGDADYVALEPTDVVTASDTDDISYRLRLVRKTDNYPLIEFEAVVDNASVTESEGVTSEDHTPSIDVSEPSDTVIELLDISIMRDIDDESGFYIAAKGDPNPWPGCVIFKSIDDITYANVTDITDSAVIGTASNALADWDGGRVFDEFNSVTVDVGEGTLSSSTRTAVLASKLTNCMLVGSEIIQFVTATLISTGVYKLTRLLRGCRGTEWAMDEHVMGERCVLLRATGGVRRIQMENSELGVTRYYAGVTFGRSLSSALIGSPEGGEPFANNAIGLKPFSPVDLRIVRDSSNNITGTFKRRTRLSTRFSGSLGINVPLGEDSESYKIYVRPIGSPNGLLRTISVSDETFTYTESQQTTDGATPGDLYAWEVVQVSATVGDGYALEKAA